MTQSGPIRKRSRDSSDLFLQILDILNPTKLALFIFLFGAIGVLSVKSIGLISLAPAIIMGWVLANVFFNLMGSILMRMHSSTNFSKQSLVGAIGELTISIPPSSTGEVVIATGSSRYSAAAKCSDPEQTIKKLTKVIVVDIKDGMFFVEPFEDTDL
jgi:membrane protein implicated in regulation of membrane protease activity